MSLGDENNYGSDAGRSDGMGGSGQTRTRLPEGEGDPYGGARRPVRASRSLITVVGVVVLLIAAIAFANRGNGSSSDSSDDSNGAKRPGSNATAASGVKPVTGSNSGIASGFAHTSQGAQSAAANYAVVLGSDGMFKKGTRHSIVNAVYAPDVAATQLSDLDKVYSGQKFLASIGLKADGSAPPGMTFVSRTAPVGTKAVKVAADTATVSVWYSSLFGLAGEGSTNPVSESWYTNTFELKWINGDWRVTGSSQKDGPVPVGRDQTASSAKDMADAVKQFGGFTYAR
ncbi:hypothetical protein [Streptomyces sp. NBC_00932]|uniref:hypothetical protein n=1 Tax=Streptomyces sp. NBC_00932 TaxID=2903690 RepID=UPI00386A8D47|nr:hypothetical protein OG221_20475 [Streptomyces sp. NBC_00932]